MNCAVNNLIDDHRNRILFCPSYWGTMSDNCHLMIAVTRLILPTVHHGSVETHCQTKVMRLSLPQK